MSAAQYRDSACAAISDVQRAAYWLSEVFVCEMRNKRLPSSVASVSVGRTSPSKSGRRPKKEKSDRKF